MKYFVDLIQKIQKERQEKQEKEEEEKKEKQRQEAEEMIRKMHENTDVLDTSSVERNTAVTEQDGTKISGNESTPATQVPEVVGETVEVDAEASSTATNTDKAMKTSTSTSSSEDVDEETLEGEEKIGKDGEILSEFRNIEFFVNGKKKCPLYLIFRIYMMDT